MDYLELFGFKAGEGKHHEEMIYRLVILYTLIFDNISHFLSKYRLTPAKLNVLMIVKHQGGQEGISQVDLSQRLMVTASNMTRVLVKLQRDGLITRDNIRNDKRFKMIRITSKGSKLLDNIWPGYTKKLVELTEGLEERKKEELAGLLSLWMKCYKNRV
jgi:DNA-binding MarR family transcriptional regulator